MIDGLAPMNTALCNARHRLVVAVSRPGLYALRLPYNPDIALMEPTNVDA